LSTFRGGWPKKLSQIPDSHWPKRTTYHIFNHNNNNSSCKKLTKNYLEFKLGMTKSHAQITAQQRKKLSNCGNRAEVSSVKISQERNSLKIEEKKINQ
jgi:hypothetical protein